MQAATGIALPAEETTRLPSLLVAVVVAQERKTI
jgi:hypothetical protein